MSYSGTEPAGFGTQANALLRKNLTFQKRNVKTNCCLCCFPVQLLLLLVALQAGVNKTMSMLNQGCGCKCVDTGEGQCVEKCGIEYSEPMQAMHCPVPHPPEWLPLLQIPLEKYRAVRTDFTSFGDLPDESCRKTGPCPVTMLVTGENQKFGQGVADNMFPAPPVKVNPADIRHTIPSVVMGTTKEAYMKSTVSDTAYVSVTDPLYYLQAQCKPNNGSSLMFPVQVESNMIDKEVYCLQTLHLWRNSSSEINDEIYKGYVRGNDERKTNEIAAAFDFLNSNEKLLNVSISYNATYKNDKGEGVSPTRVPRVVNLVSNAYLNFLKGAGTKVLFDFVKEPPKPETRTNVDIPSLLGPLFFTWVIIQLLPVILRALVYEKENKLRMMMKMHGLGDGPYWLITYIYFLFISVMYVTIFVIMGSVLGLQFFRRNNYSIQIVFYLLYVNVQISMGFFLAVIFKSVKSATVVAYMMVFGTGLLGKFLFQFYVQNLSFSRAGIVAMELYPGFSLYRGLYEFSQYSFNGVYMGTNGMQWSDLSDKDNGMKEILIIMALEHLVLLGLAYYMDQVLTAGRSPIFFLQGRKQMKLTSDFETPDFDLPDDKPDVARERKTVEQLLLESSRSHSIVCANVKKIYPARDGNPQKFAVKGLSLAIPPGECFGMLGPNGAGKTTSISMMTGLTKPSSGTVYVQGLDIRSEMDLIYTSMGVCPQHDLLWETLTGREHLLFYGRLKNLGGQSLNRAVEDSLRSVNLFDGGVADKQSTKYSGGMKRRLSVAISLIGNPRVVYMDEPSTGLDPASRNLLWDVVTNAKQDKAIILTTHSMEEAEHLCDRLGIFVDGSLQCVGNPKELKARYGGTYILTVTTSPEHEEEVERLACQLSPSATKVYHISGTQKFEMPKDGIRIADVFAAVESAKRKYPVQAWGLSDTTLEDVFIKVAKGVKADIALT